MITQEAKESLSTRLAAATELTPELREECARMLGWYRLFDGEWWHGLLTPLPDGSLPELHLGEIVAEIERRGWLYSFNGNYILDSRTAIG